MVSIKQICKIYYLILLFGVFVLNVGGTFSANNIPFLLVLIVGLFFAFIFVISNLRCFEIDKSILIYTLFVAYCFMSVLWAHDSGLAVTGSLVVLLTLMILFVTYILIESMETDINTILGYICVASFLGYLYLVMRFGISVTWALRNDTFAGADLYNANSIGRMYCIGAICGFERSRTSGANRRFFISLSVVMIVLTILSGSKTVLLFGIIYIITKYYLHRKGMGERYFVVLLIPIMLYLLYLAFMYIPALYNTVGYRFDELFNFLGGDVEKYSSTWYRMSMYQNGWKAFLKSPFIGHGMINSVLFNRFEYVYQDGVYMHSNFLEMLVNLGMIGTLLYYWMTIYALKWAIRGYKNGNQVSTMFIGLLVALLITDISSVSYLNRPSVLLIMISCVYCRKVNSLGETIS